MAQKMARIFTSLFVSTCSLSTILYAQGPEDEAIWKNEPQRTYGSQPGNPLGEFPHNHDNVYTPPTEDQGMDNESAFNDVSFPAINGQFDVSLPKPSDNIVPIIRENVSTPVNTQINTAIPVISTSSSNVVEPPMNGQDVYPPSGEYNNPYPAPNSRLENVIPSFNEEYSSDGDVRMECSPNNQPILTQLKAVVLVGSWDEAKSDFNGLVGLGSRNVNVPGGISNLRRVMEPMFVNQPLTKQLIIDMKREIILYYREQGHPLVDVKVPCQDISCGILRFVVMEGMVGEIVSEGNNWFCDETFISAISAHPGGPIVTTDLLNDVAFLNRNPFHHTDVFLAPGAFEGTTDIQLVSRDRFPVRVYAGADNTGTEYTGRGRFFAGLTWGNVLNMGHLLTYQATVSNNITKFYSHTGQYVAPLPWKHTLEFFGGYAHVEPELEGMHSHGNNSQASVRYRMPLKPLYTPRLIEFSVGFDWKNMNNNLLFAGQNEVPVIEDVVNISQFMVGIAYGNEWKVHVLSTQLEIFFGPGELMHRQSPHDFNEMRHGAKNHYIYGRYTLNDTFYLPYGFSIAGQFRGQLSNENLLPSEQFSLGGHNTVRGYEENEVTVDNGLCFNMEFRTPPYSFFKGFGWDDELIGLIFVDYGVGGNNHRLAHEPESYYLASVGPGIRYNINTFLSARLDWGVKLHQTGLGSDVWNRLEAGIIISY